MKVLLVQNLIYFPTTNGASKINRFLLEALAEKGHLCRVIAPATSRQGFKTPGEFLVELSANEIGLKTSSPEVIVVNQQGVEVNAVRDNTQLVHQLIKQIEEFRPDWVLVSSEDLAPFLLEQALRMCPGRVVYLAHTPQMFPFGPASLSPSERGADLLQSVAAIVTFSQTTARYIRDQAGLDVTVIFPLVYGSGDYPRYGSFDEGLVTLINPCFVKGLPIFLRLAQSLPEYKFAGLSGWGITKAERQAMAALPNMELLDRVDEIDSVFSKTRVLLVPSLWREGFRLVVVEAMLRGIPVVASNIGALPEAKLGVQYVLPVHSIELPPDISDKETYLDLVAQQDISHWIKVLRDLLSDRERYEHLSAASRSAALSFVSKLKKEEFENFLLGLVPKQETGKLSEQIFGGETKHPTKDIRDRVNRLSPERSALLALRLRRKSEVENGHGSIPKLPRTEPESIFPVSFAQQRLWLFDQLRPGSNAYSIPGAYHLRGPLNHSALERALSEITRRHEILRTTFRVIDGQPFQVIGRPKPLSLPVVELNALSPAQHRVETRRLATADAEKPFDLTIGPLQRFSLLRLSEEEHMLLLNTHHIVSDAWSSGIFFRELGILYQAFCEKQPLPLPDLPIQYADFAVWEREFLQGEALERQLSYWRRQLNGLAMTQLPTDRPRPPIQSFEGAKQAIIFRGELLEGLEMVSRQNGATLFMTLLAAFQVLLSRHTGQTDICVGSPIAGRNKDEIEALIGFFVNMLALRMDLNGEPSFRALLSRVKEVTLEAYAHQDMPFEKIVAELHPQRDLSRQPLFQAVFALQNVLQEGFELPGLKLLPVEIENVSPKFDLTVALRETLSGLVGAVEYATDMFDSATIERLVDHWKILLEAVVVNPESRIWELPILSEEERRQLLEEWCGTAVEYPAESCVHELFAEVARRRPDGIAVVFEDEQMSYGELEARSNRLAHYLRELGVGPEIVVGLCVERSVEMVVGLLGILKAGGAYLPLDPTYPSERLQYMLEDAQAPVVLVQGGIKQTLPFYSVAVALLDHDWKAIAAQPDSKVSSEVVSENLAYVIYTSGSTGRPKAVMIGHRQIVRLFAATADWFDFGPSDVWTLFHAYTFDFSVWEIWGALLHGGRLVIAPYWVSRTPESFYQLLEAEGVTVLNQTPSAFDGLARVDEASQGSGCRSLRRIVFGGEALRLDNLKGWFERHGEHSPALINMYGITETTVHVTYRPLRANEEGVRSPIGHRIPDLEVYVLDSNLNLLPVGVIGELFVGGAGVARGYLGQAGQAAERFVPNPFRSGERLYRTGDLVRWRECGELEFVGRVDHQVKVRGHRIELEEIKAILTQHPAVEQAVVLAKDYGPNDRRLIAYLVPHQQRAFTVRQFLRFRRQGLLNSYHELPNGLVIAHKNRGETDFMYKEIFEERVYLRHGITLGEGACIFDVGANIGLFTVFAGRACNNTVIYAFEPIPPLFDLLRLNTDLYGLNVKLFNCGLSDLPKSEVLTYYPKVSVFSGLYADDLQQREVVKSFLLNQERSSLSEGLLSNGRLLEELLEERLASEPITCQFKTISEVIREHRVERIDLLKIDVEKSELDVLTGIEQSDWKKIRQCVMEVHDLNGRLEQVTSIFKYQGYEVNIEQDALLKDTDLYNVYAVRKDQLNEVGGKPSEESGPAWHSEGRLMSDVRNFLTSKLPDYMLPGAMVALESLPLTVNGKVDLMGLPAPEGRPEEVANMTPRTPIEEMLTEIWAGVLHLERIGVHDNFFELGGDSLLATRMIAQVRDWLKIEMPLRDVFRKPSIAELAERIDEMQCVGEGPTPPPLTARPRVIRNRE